MRISFELSDQDLQHFKRISKSAKTFAKDTSEDDIVAATEKLLAEVKSVKVPDFIAERLHSLESLIGMLRDTDWGLGKPERERVLAALAYFCEPDDLIPDSIPGFGFLDDAIMIELITRELKHEIEAYDDFHRFRERENRRTGRNDTSREQWLANKRKELFERMRRRTRREGGGAGQRVTPVGHGGESTFAAAVPVCAEGTACARGDLRYVPIGTCPIVLGAPRIEA
jgi:uncharacterized membrane protein YkvA (DUF1232 family)